MACSRVPNVASLTAKALEAKENARLAQAIASRAVTRVRMAEASVAAKKATTQANQFRAKADAATKKMKKAREPVSKRFAPSKLKTDTTAASASPTVKTDTTASGFLRIPRPGVA